MGDDQTSTGWCSLLLKLISIPQFECDQWEKMAKDLSHLDIIALAAYDQSKNTCVLHMPKTITVLH